LPSTNLNTYFIKNRYYNKYKYIKYIYFIMIAMTMSLITSM